jgi:hypothetical protein
MLKRILYGLLLMMLGTNMVSSAQTMMILDKGTKRFVHIGSDAEQKSALMVKFKSEYISVESFASKYGLSFKRKMAIGYYIFDNVSDRSDADVIADIIENEPEVLSVKPVVKRGLRER